MSFHSSARWQLHFNSSKESSQLVKLLAFTLSLSFLIFLKMVFGRD
jgi:hypothetical protein